MLRCMTLFAVIVGISLVGCKKEEKPTGIQGTIRPQAGFNIDVNNIRVQIYSGYDNQTGFNGLIKEAAATGSAVEATYSMELSPGNYYVVAWKDMDNDQVLTSGDIYGFKANDLGQPLAVTVTEGNMATVDFTVYIYGQGATGNTIEGTATLAQGLTGDLSGAVASIYLTQDDWQNDAYLSRISVDGSGTTVSFTFSNVDDGTYYLDVWKDMDASGGWSYGDFAGVYGVMNPVDGTVSVLTPIVLSGGQTENVSITVYRLGG